MTALTLGKPWCDVCDRPVERVTQHRDLTMCRTIFVAHCHGEHERVDIDDEILEGLPVTGRARFGRAFVRGAALPPGRGRPIGDEDRRTLALPGRIGPMHLKPRGRE